MSSSRVDAKKLLPPASAADVDRGGEPGLRDVAAGRIDADADATDQGDGRQRDQHGDRAAPVVGELPSSRERAPQPETILEMARPP